MTILCVFPRFMSARIIATIIPEGGGSRPKHPSHSVLRCKESPHAAALNLSGVRDLELLLQIVPAGVQIGKTSVFRDLLGQPAVDVVSAAGHVIGIITCEEERHRSDFLRSAKSPPRNFQQRRFRCGWS